MFQVWGENVEFNFFKLQKEREKKEKGESIQKPMYPYWLKDFSCKALRSDPL
jgi:hypothetical protein